MRLFNFSLVLIVVLFFGLPVINPAWGANEEPVREIRLEASRYEYSPSKIVVEQGERIRLILDSQDITHGFYLEGYDLRMEDNATDTTVAVAEFVADRPGKFYFRCSTTCGPLHPVMVGQLVVLPAVHTSKAITVVLVIGLLAVLSTFTSGRRSKSLRDKRLKLTDRWSWLKKLLLSRWFQYLLILPNLLFVMFIVVTGFAGTSVGNANFATVFVWLFWLPLLFVILLPLGGRFWCAACPLPAPGEWLDRRALIFKGREKPRSTAVRGWPRLFKNIWLQVIAFLVVTVFSGVIVTSPLITAVFILGMALVSALLSIIFGRRIFCRYICPLGGFIGLYAMITPWELRVNNKMVCRDHRGQECAKGSEASYGCPWMELPWNLERNTYCGLCMECFKGCPENNVSINLRPFGADLLVPKGRGMDEAFKALTMVGCAAVYTIVFLGTWGAIKSWAGLQSTGGFLFYSFVVILFNLLLVPAALHLAVWLGRAWGEREKPVLQELFAPVLELKENIAARFREPVLDDETYQDMFVEEENRGNLPLLKNMFIDSSYTFIPLGLAVWILFSLSFVAANGSYILPVLSDPFGWGWDLFGTSALQWKPFWAGWFFYLKLAVLSVGEFAAIKLGFEIYRVQEVLPAKARLANLPVAVLVILTTCLFGVLYF